MNRCWCDRQGPADPPGTLIEATTNVHRALHDTARELIWPFWLLLERNLNK